VYLTLFTFSWISRVWKTDLPIMDWCKPGKA